ncbi:MAG: helix-turn-helix transcriptional regulator [Acidimicrobiales bacterium]
MNRYVDSLAALALLSEPLRRKIYQCAASAEAGVTRDFVTEALAIPRSVAAFHLDKLAESGLLEIGFRRPAGRGGPGAGRPAKCYRRAKGELSISVPERRYDWAGDLLAEAIERSSARDMTALEALREVAREHGAALLSAPKGPGSRSRRREHLMEALVTRGYEPKAMGGAITLANCPFRSLAESHRELVCTMNHELVRGLVESMGMSADSASLDPGPERCCVTISC